MQIGIIKALISEDAGRKQLAIVNGMLDEIIENQFIGKKAGLKKLMGQRLNE